PQGARKRAFPRDVPGRTKTRCLAARERTPGRARPHGDGVRGRTEIGPSKVPGRTGTPRLPAGRSCALAAAQLPPAPVSVRLGTFRSASRPLLVGGSRAVGHISPPGPANAAQGYPPGGEAPGGRAAFFCGARGAGWRDLSGWSDPAPGANN